VLRSVVLGSNSDTEIAASLLVPRWLLLSSKAFKDLTCFITLKGNLTSGRIHGSSRNLEATFGTLCHGFLLWILHNAVTSRLLACEILEPRINYPLCAAKSASFAASGLLLCADPRWPTLRKLRCAAYLAAHSSQGHSHQFIFKTFSS